MPYLGNEPATVYTSTTKDTFSGDASTTNFTLSRAASVNAVRVVVENVVQNPTVAYTCSGTTLSFTSAPPTGTNNIYVIHLGPPAATVAPPTTINSNTTFMDGLTLKNGSPEDTDGGRESIVTFKGLQSGQEETTLAQIQASHDGTSDDEKGDLIFKTNDGSDGASPTEAMRIDSDGNVGIGTSSPIANLDVANTGGTYAHIRSTTTGASALRIQASDTGTGNGDGLFVGRSSAVNYVWTYENEPLVFATNNIESMRIDNNNNLLVGTTSTTGGKVCTENSGVNTAGVPLETKSTTTGVGNVYAATFYNGATFSGSITVNGSSTAFNTSSDYRLKENVTDVTDGITRIKQLAPKRFNFIEDSDTTIDGFLAHEAQTVVPEAITGTHNELEVWTDGEELPDGVSVGDNKLDDDGNTIPKYQGIDQSKLVPLLTAALQEAIAKIEILETKVAALEAE